MNTDDATILIREKGSAGNCICEPAKEFLQAMGNLTNLNHSIVNLIYFKELTMKTLGIMVLLSLFLLVGNSLGDDFQLENVFH